VPSIDRGGRMAPRIFPLRSSCRHGPYAADEHYLIGSLVRQDRPGAVGKFQTDLRFPSVSKTGIGCCTVGDITTSLLSTDEAVRSVEVAGLAAALSPGFYEVSHLYRIWHTAANCRSRRRRTCCHPCSADICLLIKNQPCYRGMLDHMRQPSPWLRVCSERAHGAAFGVKAVNMSSAASTYQRLPCGSKRRECAPTNIVEPSPQERTKVPSDLNSSTGLIPAIECKKYYLWG